MSAMTWQGLALGPGARRLVEASAGTGKTWTIAVLYLRLLLEEELGPHQIVVATFTKAAAAELGERLRARVRWALEEAGRGDAGSSADDEPEDLRWLRDRWRHEPSRRAADATRLQAAIGALDGAPIGTLHALCARILAEHPFAAGAPFKERSVVEGAALARDLATDLLRRVTQADEDDPLVALFEASGLSPRALAQLVPTLLQPGVVAAAPFDLREALRGLPFLADAATWAGRVEAAADAHTKKSSRLRKAWLALAEAVRRNDVAAFGAAAEAQAEADRGIAILKGSLGHPELESLYGQTRAIVDALSPHAIAIDLATPAPLRRLLEAAQRWLREAQRQRLDASGQCTFDQLVTEVRDALAPRDGARALADALAEAWPAALVDEFQDTDPQQFAVLDAIYCDAHGAPRGRLVMIGDPKQAIYRFRGGDVAAYERAKADVAPADRLDLRVNHRASRTYVRALNAFYEAAGTRLGPAGSSTSIAYVPVEPSGRRDATPLRERDGRPAAHALVLHALAEPEPADDRLQARALRGCANRIAELLSSGARIGDEPLQPGDIAVLLPNHGQIAMLARELAARGVPCVSQSPSSVYASDAARELRVLLHAALHAEEADALRAAASTRLCDGSLAGLQRLLTDGAALDAESARFHALRALLVARGPLAVVSALLDRHAARLLSARDGERYVTDLRHVGELLQEAWREHGAGARLMRWLGAQRDAAAEDGGEAMALRLESDTARVRLMTLHASKGLEFPIVFLPLMWRHGSARAPRRAPSLLALDAAGSKGIVTGAEALARVAAQELEERHRMLYVALTRAIHACHVFTLPLGCEVGEPAEPAQPDADAPLNALDLGAVAAAGAAAGIAVVEGWGESLAPAIERPRGHAPPRRARPLPPPLAVALPRRHSFTTLIGAAAAAFDDEPAAEDEPRTSDDAADGHDGDDAAGAAAAPADARDGDPALLALAGVGGTDFGNAVHALLERRPHGRSVSAADALVALQEHGVRARHGELDAVAAALAARLDRVLKTPLAAGGGPRLWDLAAGDAVAEMGFDYRLDGATLSALRRACEAHGEADLVPAGDATLTGLMTGKIDLVFLHGGRFHVLDYKGNQLAPGPRPQRSSYGPAALERAMRRSGYRLQAFLYALALDRYLRERLGADYRRDVHLGDAWYLYIRAVGLSLDDGTPCGVWRHRFDDALLDAAQAALAGPGSPR